MWLLQYFHERSKIICLVVIAYCSLFHLAYKHLRYDTSVRVAANGHHNDLVVSLQNINGRLEDTPTAEPVIAIGSGITSKSIKNVSENNIGKKYLFFYMFLPTFCKTASPHFLYRFYLAYDRFDRVFTQTQLREAFRRQFINETAALCQKRGVTTDLVLVHCQHAGKPTWAQNNAMREAYLDHADYYYRINDDTRLITSGWTELFISALNGHVPPRVGVVGPRHFGGNTGILTYDFVHRTHIDLFGFYYPHLFTDWWGDTWITKVYRPSRSTKMHKVRLFHTLSHGQRYNVRARLGYKVGEQIRHDMKVISRYVKAVKMRKVSGVKPDGRKVISMSLYGSNPHYIWGVIRNAQLVPVYLPDWTLRVYITAEPAPSKLAVPPRIISKLRLLGAHIAYVPVTGNNLKPRNWRLLVADDQQIDYFLVRDADTRLSDREAVAVRDWVSAAEKNGAQSAVLHCIRDHPKHANQAIVDGLWGGRSQSLRQRLNIHLTDSPGLTDGSKSTRTVLSNFLWPAIADVAYCDDSVSACDRWTPVIGRHYFPSLRQGREYLEQKFDEHQQLASTDGHQLQPDVVCPTTTS